MLEIVGLIKVLGSVLGSNAVGSAIGWLGGLLNRKVDLEAKRIDNEDRKAQRDHEQALRRIDIEVMQAEAASRERVASIESEGKVRIAEYDALQESYRQESAIPEGALAKRVRPLLTLILGLAGITQAGVVLWLAFVVYRIQLSADQWHDLAMYCVAWVFFQAGVVIGWWFANRPGKAPELKWSSGR